jgi:tetratricopeptide (TPR) repeat protein
MASLGLGYLALTFYYKSTDLEASLSQSKEILQKVKDEISFLEEEKEKVVAENEALQDDALIYGEITAELREEIKGLKTEIEEKDVSLKELNEQVEIMEDEFFIQEEERTSKQKALDDDFRVLREKANAAEAALKNERQTYYYNLGVAYAHARFFDKAIDAYEKAISFDPTNADAHYNLGLLYENFKLEPEKSIIYYEKYLELVPDAKDRDEVSKWIANLKDIVYQQMYKNLSPSEKTVEVNLVN